jgi:hypothetical protein
MTSRAALREYYVDQIHSQGYVNIGIDLKGNDINPLFTTFRTVLDDVYESPSQHGRDTIAALAVCVPGRPDDSYGYLEQRRRGTLNPYEDSGEKATEDKDVLHFTPQTTEYAQEYLRTRGNMSEAFRQLFAQCTELHYEVKRAMRPALQALGLETTLMAPENQPNQDVHLVRVVRYLGTKAMEPKPMHVAHDDLAELHFDRSKMTAAVWESSSGLVGTPANNLVGKSDLLLDEVDTYAERALNNPLSHRSGLLKLFAGAGYNHLPDNAKEASGNLPLLLHGVVDDHPGEERDAIVIFINQRIGIDLSVPRGPEKGFAHVRQAVLEKQLRLGGLVMPAVA